MKSRDAQVLWLLIGAGVVGYFLFFNKRDDRDCIRQWTEKNGTAADVAFMNGLLKQFSDSEAHDVCIYLRDYISNGTRPAVGTPLYNSIQAISAKYNIFT